MRYYSFKLYHEDDPELIEWLNSITRKKRSEVIRQALRVYLTALDALPAIIPKTNGTAVTKKLYRRC